MPLMRYCFPTSVPISVKLALSETPADTVRPRIRANASRDVPVYLPSFDWVLICLPTKGWLRLSRQTWVPGSALRWFTRPKTVTHPGTNHAWRRETTLIDTNTL